MSYRIAAVMRVVPKRAWDAVLGDVDDGVTRVWTTAPKGSAPYDGNIVIQYADGTSWGIVNDDPTYGELEFEFDNVEDAKKYASGEMSFDEARSIATDCNDPSVL